MKYLPFENYVLTTNLSVDEVRDRLANNVEPQKKASISSSKQNTSKPYQGSIVNNSFKIFRIINYRNSFVPVISGEISQAYGKTEIAVKMKPVLFVLIFMAFWIGTVGVICVCILVMAVLEFKDLIQNGFSPPILIPFGMFIFGYLLITLSFKYESSTSKEFLKDLFEAQYKD
jgi:hypothetical protein